MLDPGENQEPPAPPPPSPPPNPAQLQDVEPPPLVQKRATFTDFDLDTSIPEGLPFFPAQYATDKIKMMEYVELWYFTTEGITDASRIAPTAAEDTYGLLRTDSGLAFQQIKASRASRNVISDEALTWEQIMTARHNILDAAGVWPEKHRLALAGFYMNLEALKATGSNSRALILYQATARRRWHSTLKGSGTAFNLSIINETLLLKLENQIRDRDQQEMRKQASVVSR